MHNPFYHSDQVRRIGRRVTQSWKQWSQTSLKTSRRKLSCLKKRKVAHRKTEQSQSEGKVFADSGYPNARAQEAQHVHSITTTQTEAKEKGIDDRERRVRQTVDSFSHTRSQQQDRNKPFRTRRSTTSFQFQEGTTIAITGTFFVFHKKRGQCRAGVNCTALPGPPGDSTGGRASFFAFLSVFSGPSHESGGLRGCSSWRCRIL